MNRLLAWALAAVIAVLVVAVSVQSWRLHRTEQREIQERAAKQQLVLEAAGWERAARASQRELAETVPALKTELEAAKKADVPVLAANRTQTETVTFSIPVSGRPPSLTAGAGKATSGTGSSPQQTGRSTDIGVSADVQTAIAGLDDGTIEWTSRIFATVAWGALEVPGICGEGEPCTTKELPAKTSKTGVDPELEKAWAAWKHRPPRIAFLPRPVKQWRAGWTLGAGGAIALDGHITAGAVVAWGLQF